MQQYFIDEKVKDKIQFNDEQAHHIKNVMRMKEGNIVKVVDDEENAAYVCIHYENKQVFGLLKEEIVTNDMKLKIKLAMALIKKEKWEFCVQKACECGAYEIVPFVSSRSVVKISDEKNDKKLERWQKIASEACEQSKQNHCCEIQKVSSFDEIIDVKADLKLIAYENADKIANNLARVCIDHPNIKSVVVMIGPEGGFSEAEVRKAMDKGFVCISLGQSILRAETAAICSINMLKYHYEILGELYGTVEESSKE